MEHQNRKMINLTVNTEPLRFKKSLSLWSKIKRIFRKGKSQNKGKDSVLAFNGQTNNWIKGHFLNGSTQIKLEDKQFKKFKVRRPNEASYKFVSKNKIVESPNSRMNDDKAKPSRRKDSGMQLTSVGTFESGDEESKIDDLIDYTILELDKAQYCDLFGIREGSFHLTEYSYPWLDIVSFKFPTLQNQNETKSKTIQKKSLFRPKRIQKQETKKEELDELQPFIYIKNKIGTEQNFDSWVGESNPKTILYLHDNCSDIGTVLGHGIDLASQLEGNILIPELSGFGDFNKNFNSITDKKTLFQQWLIDAKNSINVFSKICNTTDLSSLVIYSKGASTSLVLELMKHYDFKSIVFEEIHSSINSLKKKDLLFSKSLYLQLKKNYIANNIKLAHQIKSKSRTNSKCVNMSLNDSPRSEIGSILSLDLPKLLFIESSSPHQKTMSQDVIASFLANIYNVKYADALTQIHKKERLSFGPDKDIYEDTYLGCIQHTSFKSPHHIDFKKEHRSRYLAGLRWLGK